MILAERQLANSLSCPASRHRAISETPHHQSIDAQRQPDFSARNGSFEMTGQFGAYQMLRRR